MKKALIFGIAAAGAAAIAAIVLKAKSKHYICDDECECDDCYDVDCDCGCSENICDIPAEKAEESCISNAPDSSVETAEAPISEDAASSDSKEL